MFLQTRLSAADSSSEIAPTLQFSREAWDRLRAYVQLSSPNEINGFCYVRHINGRFVVCVSDDVFITKQTVTPGSAHVTGTTYGKALHQAFLDGRPEEELRLQWHSHGYGNAYHSPIDMGTIESYAPTMDWFISLVTNHYGDVTARLDMFRPYRIGAQMTVVVYDEADDVDLTTGLSLSNQIADLVTVIPPKSDKKSGKKSGKKTPTRRQLASV